jgi:sulfur carrier protein
MTASASTSSIRVNGTVEPLIAPTLAQLIAEKTGESSRGIAAAVNGAVVPRAAWERTELRAGDAVEIVRVMQGG